jgi:hypothetical protein
MNIYCVKGVAAYHEFACARVHFISVTGSRDDKWWKNSNCNIYRQY